MNTRLLVVTSLVAGVVLALYIGLSVFWGGFPQWLQNRYQPVTFEYILLEVFGTVAFILSASLFIYFLWKGK